jgi:hypothetical protein
VTAGDSLPTGTSYVCFDTTSLIHSAATGYLDELGSWWGSGAFTARHIMDIEVGRNVKLHPRNQDVLDAAWLHAVPVDNPQDLFRVAWLLDHHWMSSPGKDRGEAEVLTLCRRYGWVAIIDDERGRAYAAKPVVPRSPADLDATMTEPPIPSAMLLTTIIAAVAWGVAKHGKAWKMHCAIDRDRGSGYSLISYGDSQRPIFDACVAKFRKLHEQRPNLGFPAVLAVRGLDDLVASTRRGFQH